MRRLLTVDAKKSEAEYEEFRARVQVAEQLLEEGRFGEAVSEYESVARAFPPNYYAGELYCGLGCAFVGLGQHAHAVTVFDRALEEDGENLNVLHNKGLAQTVAGDKRGALATFATGAKLAAETAEEEHFAQFMIYVGQLHEELEEDDKALEAYLALLERGEDYSQAWYLAGCIYAKRGEKDRAIKHFREAIDCSRPWPSAYYKLSRMVADPLEKKSLYQMFVDAQRELAEYEASEKGSNAPTTPLNSLSTI